MLPASPYYTSHIIQKLEQFYRVCSFAALLFQNDIPALNASKDYIGILTNYVRINNSLFMNIHQYMVLFCLVMIYIISLKIITKNGHLCSTFYASTAVFYNAKVMFTYWQLHFCDMQMVFQSFTGLILIHINRGNDNRRHPGKCFASFTCFHVCFKTRQSLVYLKFSYCHAILDENQKQRFGKIYLHINAINK